MVQEGKTLIEIDLSQFKLHVRNANGMGLSLHFNSPSRRFYLSVIALVVNEMKKLGKVISIPLEDHYDTLALLNETIGGKAGSSDKESLLPRIYRKWKDALPDLEHAPLFRVLGRRKEYEDAVGKTYQFTDEEKDAWANLFEYMGSEEKVRPRFSVDRMGATLDQVVITYGEEPDVSNEYAWDRFIESLRQEVYDHHLKDKVALVAAPRKWAPWRRWRLSTLSGVIGLLLVGVIVAIWYLSFHIPRSALDDVHSVESPLPLPDKPSIAVLPFENLSEDPKYEHFSDGLTEEIITALCKIPRLFVIARKSSSVFKGKQVNVQQVAEELGVRYLLEGSFRKSEDRVRITAQFIDALTGTHLWAERYDRDLKDLFALQDEITMKIVTAMQLKLTEGEQARLYGKGTDNLEAYLKVLQSIDYRRHHNPEDNAKARQLAQEAIFLDPNYPLAYAALGRTHYIAARLGAKAPEEELRRAEELAKKALSLDESLANAYSLLGHVYLERREWEKAIAEYERAVELNPNGADDLARLANGFKKADRPEEAIQMFKKAIRLNPNGPAWYFYNLGASYRNKENYGEAIVWCEKAVKRDPKNFWAHLHLATAYSCAGRIEEARAESAEVLRINPKFCIGEGKGHLKNEAAVESFKNAMRKAGIPNCPPRTGSK